MPQSSYGTINPNIKLIPTNQGELKQNTVTFPLGDPANPRNWSAWRKWLIVAVILPIDLSVSWGASGFSPAEAKFAEDFGVSSEVAVLGLSLTVLGLALGPMSLAPLSEYYGRTPLYVLPYGVFLLMLFGTALVNNLGGFLALRFFSGMFSSVTVANFGGTIADLWPHQKTGLAMSFYLWAATAGSPSGYFLMSFVAQRGGWRDVFWALLGICGGFWLMLVAVLFPFNETRHSVLLSRRVKQLQTETGNNALHVPEEMQQRGLVQLFKVTLSRPFRFLGTEAIVIFGALYNGYLYGLSFLFNGAFKLVFGRKGYGFDTIHVGLAFLGLVVGISLGPITNLWQERYYQRMILSDGGNKVPNIPEARVQLGKGAALMFPISLLWFFSTCNYETYHWIIPILATVLFGWSFYTLILMVFMYTEDSYKVYSASALAGIGFVRNLAGAAFPLLGLALFTNLGYQRAGSILACLAIVLIPIPFILERYGTKLRQRSPWASQHMEAEDGNDENVGGSVARVDVEAA